MKPKVPQPLIIKKYENRRLYNTLTSQYINQDQVAQLVREGHDLRVVDAATGEDITRVILAQIVLDDAKMPNSVFPLDVLREMIVASGKATQENALRYMKSMMSVYQNAYRAMPSPLNPFQFFSAWNQGQNSSDSSHPAAPSSAATQEPPGASDPGSKQISDVAALTRRIEELEAALANRKSGKKVVKGKSRRRS